MEKINIFTFNGKKYQVDYNWGKHYVTGYTGSGRTASGAYPTAGVTIAGPSGLLGKVCLIKGVAGPKGSAYDGLYRFEDTGGTPVETGTSATMGVPVVDIYFDNYDQAAGTTANGWTTVEVFILKEKK